ncbi:protein SRC2-like [Capsicum chacoense]
MGAIQLYCYLRVGLFESSCLFPFVIIPFPYKFLQFPHQPKPTRTKIFRVSLSTSSYNFHPPNFLLNLFAMELRPLDIKVISAENIKNVNTFSKMDVYAEVFISSYSNKSYRQKTLVDKNSGPNPKWNHSMKFTLDESSINKPGLYLVIRLKSERTLGDKEIGEVSVPVNEMFNQETSSAAAERFVEYPVVTESGKLKGTLKFSYKFGEKFTAPEKKKDVNHEPVTAYPAAPYGMAYNQQNSGYAYPPPQAHQGGYPAGYPPAGAPGYAQPGYGYPPVQQPGYGYPPVQPPKRKNKFGGGGLGLGLGAGLLGGLLVGDMISDVGEMSSYADGYGDAMDDMGGGFDF